MFRTSLFVLAGKKAAVSKIAVSTATKKSKIVPASVATQKKNEKKTSAASAPPPRARRTSSNKVLAVKKANAAKFTTSNITTSKSSKGSKNKKEIIAQEENQADQETEEDLAPDAAFHASFRLLQHSPLAAIRRSEEHVARGQNRYNYFRKLRGEILTIKSMQELLNASALVCHEARTSTSSAGTGRVLMRRISHFIWLEQLPRLLRPNDPVVYESSIRASLEQEAFRRPPSRTLAKVGNVDKQNSANNNIQAQDNAASSLPTSSLNSAITSLEMLDDVFFWWKDAGSFSLHANDALELVRSVNKDNSPVTRLLKCLMFLSTPPFGSDLGRYITLFTYRVREHSANSKFDDELKEHRQVAKETLTDETYSRLLSKYVDLKQQLLKSLEETRAAAWEFNTDNNSNNDNNNSTRRFSQVELRTRILDVMAMGSQLAREQHLIPSKDAEQILIAVHHCLGGCISKDGDTCFTADDFMGKKNSILPFCFSSIAKARQVDATWADRTLSLVFAWTTAFASTHRQRQRQQQQSSSPSSSPTTSTSVDTDKLIRFALTVAIKQGIPTALIVRSPLLLNGVMSFFGVVSCLSVPILRPVAKMMPVDSLRNIFDQSSGRNELTSAQLVTILPFVALHIPQIAPEVAGALAKLISSNNNNNNSNNSSTASNTNSAAATASTGLSAVPSVITLIGDRFRLLCNNKWLEINAEVRENVSNILLADMVDPSMTTQSVQLFTQHPDKIPAFFAALFNWGLSDQALARLKVIYDRVPADVKTSLHTHNNTNGGGCFHDLKFLADSVAVFIPESNVRQGAHAERCISIMRAVTDPLVAAALESLNEHTEPRDVWTLYVSVYKLFANACISADVSQRAIATIGVFFKNEDRLRSVLVGAEESSNTENNKSRGVENVLFLLRTGTEDSYTSSFLSGSAKSQIAAPLLNVILEQMNKEAEQETALIMSEGVQEFTSVDDLFGGMEGNTKTEKQNDEPKVSSENNNAKKYSFTWKGQHAAIFASLIKGHFITSPVAIPKQLLPFEITDSTPDTEMRNLVLEWLEVMATCAATVDPSSSASSSSATSSSATTKTKKKAPVSSDKKAEDSSFINNDNNNQIAISDLPPFSQWLRKKAEPYVEFLVDQRAKLPVSQIVRTFVAIDALGLTFPQVLDALSDQTYRLTFTLEVDDKRNNNGDDDVDVDASTTSVNDSNEGKSHQVKDSLAEIMGGQENNNNNNAETMKNSGEETENDVAGQLSLNEDVNNKTRLQFVTAIANSNIKVVPERIVKDSMSIIERLQRMESARLSFDEIVALGIAAGTLSEKRADVLAHLMSASTPQDFASDDNRTILTSTIRRVAAAAIIATNTSEQQVLLQQQHQQQQKSNNNNFNNSNAATDNSVCLATSSLPLTPSQAIGLLRSLSVSGVSQNSVFASLVAVLDQARKSAPLLEADVLSLCSIVADMSKRSGEGRLSASACIDLDVARAAAQDALAQLLRFLVRSKSLDRIKAFGPLLDAVVSVLSTSIELHTMQELATSAMSRAQRGQLSAADVETILRIITNRLSTAPHLAQQLSRTTLPDLRTHVGEKCFPSMSARATCSCLYLIHQCYPLQHCSATDIDFIVTAFERRIMDVGKQLDVASITMLCNVYLDLRRSSTVLQHVLKHLASKIDPSTVTLKHIRDTATAMIGLKSPHREAMGFLERRMIQILNEKSAAMQARDTKMPPQLDPALLAETLAIFSVNRDPQLGDAVAQVLTAVYIPHFSATQASSVAHSLALLGVRNAATYNRLLSVVYAERRGSLFSNQAVVANLLYVFDTLQREVHPDLYDLISPRRNMM